MNPISRVGGVLRSLVTSLGKAFLSFAETPTTVPRPQGAYGDYQRRLARYALLTAYYENTAYDDLHLWAEQFRVDFKLSPDIRNVFNPAHRAVEFWANHIYPGAYDRKGGDGTKVPSAIPVVCERQETRDAIVKVLDESLFEVGKTVFARLGSMLGDVVLYAVFDPVGGRCYLEVVHPESLVEYVADPTGVCLSYAIEEPREDPDPLDPQRPAVVRFREQGTLLFEGGRPKACRFQTFISRNGGEWEKHAWDGNVQADWVEPYPFVPMVLVPHVKVMPRCPFGQACITPIFPKIRELDDMASRVGDYVGKAVDPVWLFKGISATDLEEAMADLKGGRSALPALAGGDNAAAQALLANLDLGQVLGVIDRLLEDIKDEMPELRRDIESAAGDPSGVALRDAKQRIQTAAQTIRASYDHALRLCLRYCLVMGGMAEVPGFEAFTPEAIDADPALVEFQVGQRPVFQVSELDRLLTEKEKLANMESADRAGIPVTAWLEHAGETALLELVRREQKAYLAAGLTVGRSKQASPVNDAAAKAVQAPGGATA